MAEGILERSDLGKIIADADNAGYNRGYNVGYSAGKQNASGLGGIAATSEGVQYVTTDNITMSTSKGSYGWNNFRFGSFPVPATYQSCKNAAVLHVFNASLYIVSSTGKYYTYGYCYDDDRGNPVTVGEISVNASDAGRTFPLKSIMLTNPFNSRYYIGLCFHGGNGEATTVARASYSYQWYILQAS